MSTPEHFFCSSSDGALYDTRRQDWSKLPPLRAVYSQPQRNVHSGVELRAALRANYYPSYDTVFLTDDGASLCAKCVKEELRQITYSIRHNLSDGWRVISTYCAEQCSEGETCEHCGTMLDPFWDEEANGGAA